jgi:dTDP-4-dehydrorhamnose reductase
MIWLIGNRGMLGSDVEEMLNSRSMMYIASDIDIDITDYTALRDFASSKEIDWIINCSAYTAVDKAEEEREKAYSINADGVNNIARVAKNSGASLVHVSTDYVFDGEKNDPYLENDETNPLGVYGQSKREGEERIISAMERYFIIRTAWLYGAKGNNFVRTMLRLFRERNEVRVVADQWGSPTYSKDLASALMSAVTSDTPRFGMYHFTNEGRTNWYEFAREIYTQALRYGHVKHEVNIIPITTSEFPTKAVRPRNSYLSKEKIIREMGIECRAWQKALEEFMKNLKD